MEPFSTHSGIVVPLDRANVDTDLIIPKQFLKSVKRTGFGPNLFDQLRYLDEGQPGMDNSQRPLNPDFVLNQERYRDATVLLARENFGCGSSREHAPWALLDYGIKVILAPSFADIFYNNCFKNSILPIIVSAEQIDRLFLEVVRSPQYTIDVDLEKQVFGVEGEESIDFEIEPSRKQCLLKGLDDIGITLEKKALIQEYERRRKIECPWLFDDLSKS